MVPFNMLDPSQQGIVGGNIKTNLWLIGYPGSGKSVVLTHLAKQKIASSSVAVVTYTLALGDLFKTGLNELGITNVSVFTPSGLLNGVGQYDYIICDEIQDLSAETLHQIKSRCQHLIAAGDANQSIYERDIFGRPVMDSNDPMNILGVTPLEQNVIYRLTRSIVDCAVAICPNMSSMRTKIDLSKQDTQIIRRKFSSQSEECSWVYIDAHKRASRGERSACLFSTKDALLKYVDMVLQGNGKSCWNRATNRYGNPDYGVLNRYLSEKGIRMYVVANGYGSLADAVSKKLVILTTYHSAKGLDFENVYLPLMTKNLYLLNNVQRSRTLLMVALTRSSKILTLSYTGEMSDYIKPIQCIDISMSNTSNMGDNSDDDIF